VGQGPFASFEDARNARARQLGAEAESAVAEYLAMRGIAIVARNLRVGRLELDIVARDGPVVLVVEVRARGPTSWTRALGSLDWQKRFRVRRAGERLWRMRYRHDASVERMRFDAASVRFATDGHAVINYVKAAF
jgi:putative endonuclease